MNEVNVAKNLGVEYNVSIRVLDQVSGQVVSEHVGHNAATNSMMLGIAQYITGMSNDANMQGYGRILVGGEYQQPQVASYIPKFISLGTMGLINQEQDENGLPAGIGVAGQSATTPECERFAEYMIQEPGYGACGYDKSLNNGREYFGLGPMFADRKAVGTIDCELISPSFPRSSITFRQLVPENEAEQAETIDVVFSAMISTGALAQFREPGKDYVFITEVGLWSKADWESTDENGDNGMLAGYRIVPADHEHWTMADYDEQSNQYIDPTNKYAENRDLLKRQIIRVGKNQVVQVIWKISLGSLRTLAGISDYMKLKEKSHQWIIWK